MKRVLFFSVIILVVCILGFRNQLIETFAEKYVNQTQKIFFQETFDLEGITLDRNLILRIEHLSATWHAPEGSFPFEIRGIEFKNPLPYFFQQKPVKIEFAQFAPKGSSHPGIAGNAVLLNDPEGTLELNAEFIGLYLEELISLDPVNLKGSSGKLTGRFYLKSKLAGEQKFNLDLEVSPPGGKLQARFFDVLKPYLPASEKVVLETIAGLETVNYTEATLDLELAEPERIKIFLHIFVPDYNLNLNLNIEIRVETQEAFFQLAEVMGLVQVNV